MAKTRSGKKIHNLCNNVPSKNKKKKTKNYSVTDKITNDRTKMVGARKSERNVVKSSDAEKMKAHREIRKLFKISEYKEYLEKERIRSKKNRKLDAVKREFDPELLTKYREKEKLRKRQQRAKSKSKKDNIKKQKSEIIKHQRICEYKKEISNLNLKLKSYENKNRTLKSKLKSTTSVYPMIDENSPKTSKHDDTSTKLLESVSPRSKKRAVRRLKLSTTSPTISPAKRDLHLDRVNVKSLGRPSITKEKVEAFLVNDENTVIVPDIKKAKKDLRYRLMSIKDLHLKFITDNEIECSYQHFARQVPDNIIKPKPEDWGTCLCMVCLNPELKLECIKRTITNVNLTLDNLTNKDYEDEIKTLYEILKKVMKYLNI